MKPWIQQVIAQCASQGGKMTSQDIAHAAACCAVYYANPSALVARLRDTKEVRVEVVGYEKRRYTNVQPRKLYRVTVRQ